MAKIVELPRLSDTMQEGAIARWHVAVGDKVKRGQVIAEIETDKATMEFESFDAGTVLKLLVSEGDTLPLGTPIALLGEPGEKVDDDLGGAGKDSQGGAAKAKGAGAGKEGGGKRPSEQPNGKAEVAKETKPPAQSAQTTAPANEAHEGDEDEREEDREATEPAKDRAAKPSGGAKPSAAARDSSRAATSPTAETNAKASPAARDSSRVAASPVARKLAREHEIELGAIDGSGPHGRVVKSDVQAAIDGAATADGTRVKMSPDRDDQGRPFVQREPTVSKLSILRRTMARRMTEAKQQIPHFYLTISVDMERALRLRADYNTAISDTKVSVNDIIILAAAKALLKHPGINARYDGDTVIESGDVHVGVAMAVQDGLLVPVVRHADQKTLRAISLEVRDFGKRAKTKQLDPKELTGSTFTVSNLGMFGIDEFIAVVNPGEAAIIAIGQVEDAAVVVDGAVVIRKRMKVTLSADHRVTDGAKGARFLATLRTLLENPMGLFA